jgi:hypothetical protein
VEELIEVAPAVFGECLTVCESAFAIKSQCWLEGGATSGLQAEPTQTAPASFANDVLEERTGNAFT